jgi:hypothetical protein
VVATGLLAVSPCVPRHSVDLSNDAAGYFRRVNSAKITTKACVPQARLLATFGLGIEN